MEIQTVGQADGVVNLLVSHLTVSSLPSMIPDKLEITVTGLEEGSILKASEIVLPEGVTLVGDANADIATVFGTRVALVEEEAEEEVEGEDTEPESEDDAGK